jgi:hypothetical protein
MPIIKGFDLCSFFLLSLTDLLGHFDQISDGLLVFDREKLQSLIRASASSDFA